MQFSWAPLHKNVSRLEIDAVDKVNRMAKQLKQQIAKGQFSEATNTWGALENVISENSNSVVNHDLISITSCWIRIKILSLHQLLQ